MLFPEYKVDTGAVFSPCGAYRYSLWRIWNKCLPLLGVLLLNPSKADADNDDPTVYRCGQRARHLGYGGLLVSNIFAYRSTDPGALYTVADPIGLETDEYIVRDMCRCKQVICGWGKHGAYLGRGASVCALLLAHGITPTALSVNADGSPEHPLYLPYALKPKPYTGELPS